MTSGAESGTTVSAVRSPWLILYSSVAAIGAAVAIVDAFSQFSDTPSRFSQGGLLQPLLTEFTSVLALLVLVPLIWRLVNLAPPGPGGWRRFALVHIVATLPFSALHVVLFDGFRWLAQRASHLPVCCVKPTDFPYEYRKDVLTYAAVVVLMSGLRLLLQSRDTRTPSTDQPMIALRDGSRTFRIQPIELAAVRAAGNYVEYLIADGRVIMERSTLGEAEVRLTPFGLKRCHRSWLLNPTAVRSIQRASSGDRTVSLLGGFEAPVSRRYGSALSGLDG